MSGDAIRQNEFSSLLENAPVAAPAGRALNLPRVGRAGIGILFPSREIADFVSLITEEMSMKGDLLSPRQSVGYLRFRGSPLVQCSVEQITELLFRLCCRYKIQEAGVGERKIDLATGLCSSDHLALLKGLGFNHVRLLVDASTGRADMTPVESAVKAIRTFDGYRISCEIRLGAGSSREFLRQLTGFLFDCGVSEIEFFSDGDPPRQFHLSPRMFRFLSETLLDAGYRLVGNRCFKRHDHPDLTLLRAGKLGYGPWGFHDIATVTWLGLGPGAEGMIAGYLYRNIADPDSYRANIGHHISPISDWSRLPLEQDRTFGFIQQIYCENRVGKHYFRDRGELLDRLTGLGWLEETADHYKLTEDGTLHLTTICNLFFQRELMGDK